MGCPVLLGHLHTPSAWYQTPETPSSGKLLCGIPSCKANMTSNTGWSGKCHCCHKSVLTGKARALGSDGQIHKLLVISVLRAKSQNAEDGEAQCWAFLGGSDSPDTIDYLKYSISSILVERDIEDEAVVNLFDNGYVRAIKPGGFLTLASRIT